MARIHSLLSSSFPLLLPSSLTAPYGTTFTVAKEKAEMMVGEGETRAVLLRIHHMADDEEELLPQHAPFPNIDMHQFNETFSAVLRHRAASMIHVHSDAVPDTQEPAAVQVWIARDLQEAYANGEDMFNIDADGAYRHGLGRCHRFSAEDDGGGREQKQQGGRGERRRVRGVLGGVPGGRQAQDDAVLAWVP